MAFQEFVEACDHHLVDLKNRRETGVFVIKCDLFNGLPSHAEQGFTKRKVWCRKSVTTFRPAKILTELHNAAQKKKAKFYGRIGVEFDIFDGTVVDVRKTIVQTFRCGKSRD